MEVEALYMEEVAAEARCTEVVVSCVGEVEKDTDKLVVVDN